MPEPLMLKIALIGALGMAAQWIAWRTRKPAIVFMLAAGIIAGPILGLLDPARDFGDLQQPIIKLAVAVILFEGGLQLNFRDLREAGRSVKRLIFLGVPLGWAACTFTVHWGIGLSWELSALFGGILVVTGPTVIGPMLRAISVPRRVADTLKWEAIINDPIGALLAIIIFAQMTFAEEVGHHSTSIPAVLGASAAAAVLGFALGFAVTWAFPRGYVPEYLKAPMLLVLVIVSFVIADTLQHESGLITVTVMGVTLANRPTFSSGTIRRFKEDLAVLLIAGVFIILSATLDWQVVSRVQWNFIVYILMLMFLARPLTVVISLLGSDMPWRERLFIAWIAPRGIVAVAITGLFALRLTENDVPGAELLVPLAFFTAITTIVAHGFTARWWAGLLGIARGEGNALMIVGINQWSAAAAAALKDAGVEVMMTDNSKFSQRHARALGLESLKGDVLSDKFRHRFDWIEYHHVIAASDSDAYNAFVCAELGPELGYDKVLQIAPDKRDGMTQPKGGTVFPSPVDIYQLQTRATEGWTFSPTRITQEYDFDAFQANLSDGDLAFAVVRANGTYEIFSSVRSPAVGDGDTVITFVPPETGAERKAKRDAKGDGKKPTSPVSA
ncbi:cation:proton antiporter [Novosphingobium aquimarinum]|uniref:cation:proton antiporter n=1 Tax=Novosphingobium aquimarinum TaxID=2682494 RepID=UPI001E472D20|nr:sodium:proton antiporter [Novosphingobium aquimarinum]